MSPRTIAKDIEKSRRIPDRSEVKAVLEQYFIGPITEDIVTKLMEYVERIMREPLYWVDGPLATKTSMDESYRLVRI